METVIEGNASTASKFRFAGKHGYVTDGFEVQLLGARYYLPRFGRFLTQDPIGMEGGINLYSYALNNPTVMLDPTGHQARRPNAAETKEIKAQLAAMKSDGASKFAAGLERRLADGRILVDPKQGNWAMTSIRNVTTLSTELFEDIALWRQRGVFVKQYESELWLRLILYHEQMHTTTGIGNRWFYSLPDALTFGQASLKLRDTEDIIWSSQAYYATTLWFKSLKNGWQQTPESIAIWNVYMRSTQGQAENGWESSNHFGSGRLLCDIYCHRVTEVRTNVTISLCISCRSGPRKNCYYH